MHFSKAVSSFEHSHKERDSGLELCTCTHNILSTTTYFAFKHTEPETDLPQEIKDMLFC